MNRRHIEKSRLGYHVILGPRDGGVISATAYARRIVARAVHESCADKGLLAFGLADTHLHLLLSCQRLQAGRVAKQLALMLNWRLDVVGGFRPAYIKPISDAGHLFNTFRYVLRQADRHGLDCREDPWSEGSSLVDLLGWRPLGAHVCRSVQYAFPRLRRGDFLDLSSLGGSSPVEMSPDKVIEAAKAAALVTSLDANSSENMLVKHAIVEILVGRLVSKEIASRVGLGASTVRRLRKQPACSKLVNAIHGQLALYEAKQMKSYQAMQKPLIPFRGS